jgi:hypothetical protein
MENDGKCQKMDDNWGYNPFSHDKTESSNWRMQTFPQPGLLRHRPAVQPLPRRPSDLANSPWDKDQLAMFDYQSLKGEMG